MIHRLYHSILIFTPTAEKSRNPINLGEVLALTLIRR